MHCLVYRSTARQDTYLFVASVHDLDELPDELRRRLGRLELALELELTPDRALARTDGATIMAHLERHGYYLQLPPEWHARQ